MPTKRYEARKKKKRATLSWGIVRRVGSGLMKVLALMLALIIVSVSFVAIYQYLLTSPHLKLRTVEMEGADEDMRRELIKISGLSPEMSLISLKLGEVKRKMEKHPWVRSIRLERKFPHTLLVRVEKEEVLALVIREKIYYLNKWGEIFKEVNGSEDIDYPVVTGVESPGAESHQLLKRAAHIMCVLESKESPWSIAELSEIHMKDHRNMSLYFDHLSAEIKLICDELEGKIDELRIVAEHLKKAGRLGQVKAIDFNYVDGAVVSFRNGYEPIRG